MREFVVLAFVAFYTHQALAAEDGGPSDVSSANVAKWVLALSSPDYAKREHAEVRLREAGLVALPVLQNAVRQRGEAAVRAMRIRSQIREQEFRSLCENASKGDVVAAKGLPMWERFRVSGLSEADRATVLGNLMLAVFDTRASEGLIFPIAGHGADERSGVYSEIYRRLITRAVPYRSREQRVQVAAAALLFGGHPATVLRIGDGFILGSLLSRADASQIVANGGPEKGSKSLAVIEWLASNFAENLPNDGKVEALERVLQNGVSETAPLCRVVLEHGVSPIPLARAAAALSKSGGRSDVEYLQPLLDRTHIVVRNGTPVLLQDVALYAAIVLTEQDPKDYGLTPLKQVSSKGFDYSRVRFSSRYARAKAFQRWDEWERSQFHDQLPPPKNALHGERL